MQRLKDWLEYLNNYWSTHSPNSTGGTGSSCPSPAIERKKQKDKPKDLKESGGQRKKNINLKIIGSIIFGLVFSFLSVVDVFAAQTKRIIIPAYKLYVLPIHKHIYVSTMKLVHYNGISRSFLEKRYPGLDLNILDDLKSAERHPSVWLEGSLSNGKRKSVKINLLQVMTTSTTFPNTVEMKYDTKNSPWFLQRLRTFQFLMTEEAVQVGRIKTKSFESYPINLHLEVNYYLWKNGFRGEPLMSYTQKPEKVIKDENSEDPYETPHLANICTISNDIKELGYDLKENGIVVVKNILNGMDD